MTTTVIKDWILDNAPDSATHYGGTNSDGFYLKKLIDRSGDCWFKCERDSYRWTKYQNIYRLDDIRSLSDIRRVVELEKEIKGYQVALSLPSNYHIPSLKAINDYIDEGLPDIKVVRSEIAELICRAEGTYTNALKEQEC